MTAPFSLNMLPKQPGVYMYKDARDDIIYVGKAKQLQKRIKQYFTKNQTLKTKVLVKNIVSVETIITNTEIEALLLENKLIKQYKPKYNINLKDSKTYAYLKMTDEKYPRLMLTRTARKSKRHPNETYYGPFTNSYHRRRLQILATKLYKLRTCRNLPKTACLNYHLDLCTAPCINKVNKQQYEEQVKLAKKFLNGETKSIVKELTSSMHKASDEMKFERALELRDSLRAIKSLQEKQTVDLINNKDQDVIAYITNNEHCIVSLFNIKKGVISGKKDYRFECMQDVLEQFITAYYETAPIPSEVIINVSVPVIQEYLTRRKGVNVKVTIPQRGEKAQLLNLALKNAQYTIENTQLKELQSMLNLASEPTTIECFDISNLGSEHIVAGMTQFVHGKPNKEGYRRFEIQVTKIKGVQDDFASMYEAVYRRYKRCKKNGTFPDLIMVDGGTGQLNAAIEALRKLSVHVPIIGLAKQEEEIYLPGMPAKRFNKNSKAMLLLRYIRDCTHNYVINYNKIKRKMKFKKSIQR